MEELEPRLLLSADLFPFVDLPFLRTPFQPAADTPHVQMFDAAGEASQSAGQFPPEDAGRAISWLRDAERGGDTDVASALAPAPYGSPEREEPPATGPNQPGDAADRRELVFVDPGAPNYQKLVEDLKTQRRDGTHIEVVLLAADRDGIEQITETLRTYRELDAVHVVSHGANGRMELGTGVLGTDTVEPNKHAIESWGGALNEGADLLFYGCDLASQSEGRTLIDTLARLTGADVAASTDTTGHAARGGDWDLEYRAGETETPVAFSPEMRSDWQGTLATEILLSTDGDVVNGGQSGTSTWESGDALRVGDPNFSLGAGTTDGTVSVAFDMENFAPGANATALHYVSKDIQVGASGFQLKAGDLLLATEAGATLSSTSTASGAFTNNLTVASSDVFVFRPDSPGDYSSGTFAKLLESPMAGAAIRGVSLVEQDTFVGDSTVAAGDFFLLTGSPNQNDIIFYQTTDVGAGTTSGTGWLFIEGKDVFSSPRPDLMGIELVEETVTVGGKTLSAGNLLLSINAASAAGDNALAVDPYDVFALDVTSTTYGSGSSVTTASMVLDGSGLAFDTAAEALDGVALAPPNNSAPVLNAVAPSLTTITEDDAGNPGDSVSSILGTSVSDADGDPVGMAITATSNGNGTWEYSTDGGSSWAAVGTVADDNALLLRDTDWIRFVPDGQNADSASITYRAWDQSGPGIAGGRADTTVNGGFTPFSTATDTASITVTAVNDAPVNTVPGTQTTAEDTPLVFSSSNGNPIAVSDVDAGGNPVEVTLTATDGALTLNGTTGLTFTAGDGSADTTMTFTGMVADINAALDGMSYAPDPDWNGSATITLTTSDRGNSGATPLDSDANLTARYHFDVDGTDDVGGNDATLFNGAAVVADGERGNVLDVDGVDDYAEIPATVTSGLSQFTFSFWVRTTESGTDADFWQWPTLFGMDVGGTANDLVINTSNGYIGMFTALSGTGFEYLSTTTQINDDQWHQITVSNDGVNASLYVDGVFETALATGNALDNFAFYLGAQSFEGSALYHHSGSFDDLRIFDRALSSGEVRDLYTLTDSDVVDITVNSVNDAPIVTDASFTVDENAPAGTVVGDVLASDVEAETFTKMYWIDEGTNKIQRADLDGSNVEDLVTGGLIDPVDLAVDTIGDKIYWVDRGTGKLQRANLDGSGVEDLVTGLGTPRGIAVDPVGGKVYWTDDLTDKIQRANLDGSNVEDLITTGIAGTRGITLDTAAGKMYWADLETDKIQRANLDGSNVEDLVVSGLGEPRGIALDLGAGKMYWADVITGKIQRANLDGSALEDVITGLADPIGIALDVGAGKMYWTDFADDKIRRANLDGSDIEDLVTSGLDIPVGISLGDPLQTLGYAITGGNTGGAFAIDPATGRITVADSSALDFETNPSFTLTVEVTDFGGQTGTGTVTVSLVDQNDAPAAADGTVSTGEDTPYAFSAGDFNFSDADSGDSLQSVTITALPAAGVLELSGAAVTAGQVIDVADINAGNLTFTPAPDANGADYASFGFTVSDGTLDSSPANTLTIDVTAVNDAPAIAVNAGLTVDEGFSATITNSELAVADVDNGPAEIVYTLTAVPGNGVLQLSGVTLSATDTFTQDDIDAGRVVYVHNGTETTSDSFTFTVSDGAGGSIGSTSFDITVNPVDDAPVVAVNNGLTLDEGTSALITNSELRATDGDNSAIEITYTVTGLPGNGDLQLSGVTLGSSDTFTQDDIDNGRLAYVHDGSETTTDGFVFDVSDGTSTVTGSVFSISVAALNDAPVLDSSGAMVLTDVDEDDTDPAGDTVSAVIASAGGDRITDADAGAVEGIAVIGADDTNGTWQYDAGSGWTDFGAVSDSSAVLLDTAALIRFVPDPDYNGPAGDITFRAWDQTSGASGDAAVDVSANGGTTAFSAETETATLDVTAVNDAPVLDSSGAMVLTDVDEDDTDPAGDTVSAVIASAGGDRITDADAGAVEGIAVIGADDTNGTWQYDAGSGWTDFGAVSDTSAVLLDTAALIRFVPDPDYNGPAGDITFRAWDQTSGASGDAGVDVSANGGTTAFSSATETATLDVIAVNDAPAAADNTVTTNEDTAYVFSAADFGFSDVDAGDSLQSVTVATLPGAGSLELSGVAVTAGQVIDVADIAAGNLTFTPAPDASGTGYASFRFTVSDGTADSGPATMTIDVTAVNDAPVNNVPGAQSTDADTALVFSSAGGNPISVSDVDAGSGLVEVTLTATDGTLTLAGTAGLSFSIGTGTGDITMTFTGTVTDVNAALDGLAFDPVLGFTGLASLTITTDDQGQTGTGGSRSDTDTISIGVDPVAPTANDDPGGFSTLVQSFDPSSYWRLGESAGTAAGDSGSTGNGGTYNSVTLGEAGALAGDTDTGVRFDGSGYVEIPHSNDYLLDSGTVQLWFNVDAVTGLDQGLFSKDHTGLGTGGHLTLWVTDTGTVRGRLQNAVSDSHFVESTNPVTAGQWHHVALTFGAGGMKLYVDGALVDANSYTGGTGVTAGGAGNFEPIALGAGTTNSDPGSVEPANDFFTGALDEVAVFGGQLSGADISRLYTVGTRDYVVDEDELLSVDAGNGVLANDLDPQDDPLSAVLVSGPSNAASFTLNTDGSFSYTPTADFNGTDSFTYYATDGTNASNTATATLTVTAVNDPPVSTVPGAQTTVEDTALVFSSANGNVVSVSDPDVGAGDLEVTLSVANGTLTLAGTAGLTFSAGSGAGDATMTFTGTAADINAALDGLTFDPTSDFSGASTLTIATDDQGNTGAGGPLSDTASVDISVSPVNDPPVITSTAAPAVPENTTAVLTVTSTDVDGGAPTHSITGGADGALFSIDSATGALRFNTAPNFEAPADADADNVYQVQVTVDDGNGGAAVQDISVSVTPVNEAPVLDNNAGLTVSEGGSGVVEDSTLRATDEDDAAAQISFQLTAGPSYGRLELTTAPGTAITSFTQDDIDNNRVVYVHDDSNTTSDSFTFTFGDGVSGVQGPATFTITVIPVDDDAPVLSVNTGSTTSGGTSDTIISTELRYNDSEQLPADVTYTVTGGLADGHLELKSAPGVAITSFTQADIDAGDLVYVRDNPDSTSDGFDFSVDDSQGNVLTGQTFAVTVSPPDDSDDTGIGPVVVPEPDDTDDPPPDVEEPDLSDPTTGDGDTGGDADAGGDGGGSTDSPGSTPSPGGGVPPAAGDPGAADTGSATPPSVSAPILEARDSDAGAVADRSHQRTTARLLAAQGAPDPGLDMVAFAGAPTAAHEIASLPGQEEFKESLDRVREEVRDTVRVETTVVGSTVAVTTGLSVGYVLWLVRGGLLFASLLSSMPAWRVIDPLPVLTRFRGREDGEGGEAESLGSLVSRRADAAPPEEPSPDGREPGREMPAGGGAANDAA